MAFDKPTRNRLAKFVADARDVIADEFTEQFKKLYGISATGEITPLEDLRHLDDAGLAIAERLRERIDYLVKTHPDEENGEEMAVKRLAREQAFTILNRFAAVRMAEKRGLIEESVGQGYQSKGFTTYEYVAGSGIGEIYERYRRFLFCLFDELTIDLGVLFDRASPSSLLFPRETALLTLLKLFQAGDLERLWEEDETIGWIYQYYNDPEERKKMRKESAAPRNSRELAVRNQFFTPRYVVEFLTDNTLGRIWYEMSGGATSLKDQCRYLVRRPDEVFLCEPDGDEVRSAQAWLQGADEPEPDAVFLGYTVNGYARLGSPEKAVPWMERKMRELSESGAAAWKTQEILDLLFIMCRSDRSSEGFLDSHEQEVAGIIREIRLRRQTPEQEGISQEELLKQPVHIPHRPLKDPREIRLLDPACGSMHFGLYAFDLFETIYEEAWDNRSCPALHSAYPSGDEFLKDVPRLIIEHNIHGVDIDPRAVQIAGLSLWLRAQKSWQTQKVPAADRPRVRRSNIVCAEPMPGSPEMLEEFVATLDPPLLGELVKTVFDKMQLAGEAGSLLKIEEEIRTAIDTAKKAWEKLESKPRELFSTDELNKVSKQPELSILEKSVSSSSSFILHNSSFWETAEDQVIAALKAYAESADSQSYQRRLFADDAARGFAFIDLCRKRYDSVVMNPPFGEASNASLVYIDERYNDWNKNVLCAFIERMFDLCASLGCVGAIFDRTAVIKSTYEDFRKRHLVPDDRLRAMADLGWEVLDANVEVTTSVISKVTGPGFFIDVRNMASDQKGCEIQRMILNSANGAAASGITIEEGRHFERFPNAVIGYDFPRFLRNAFARFRSLSDHGILAYQGHALKSDKHFRVWWECKTGSVDVRARLFNGAGFTPYKAKQFAAVVAPVPVDEIPKNSSTVLRNSTKHHRRGVCFGKRGEYFSAHVLPDGFNFTVEGQAFPLSTRRQALALLGYLNTPLVRFSLNRYCGQHKYSGYVNLLPYIRFENEDEVADRIADVVDKFCQAESLDELSPIFQNNLPWNNSLSNACGIVVSTLEAARDASRSTEEFCSYQIKKSFELLADEQDHLNEFKKRQPSREHAVEDVSELRQVDWFITHSLASNLVGTAFGRWDIRFATGERQPPELPDPFAPLPVCPPGMLQNAEGLPMGKDEGRRMKDEGKYSLRVSWEGILVDDAHHPEDIVARVREAIEVIWKDRAESIEEEACEILGVNSLRDYFAKPAKFFADHLKRYSKSRRQAPIYWPLSTRSGSYTLWLYYHRLSDQTLHTCLADFLDPRIKKTQKELDDLNASGKDSARIGELRDFLDELHDLRDEIERVIKLPWKPNLNDGVLITASPLHKLFGLSKWQKALEACWKKLEKGDYDWAHLAYSIWPQRVEKACEKDRSIAIAHGLEDLCKVEPPKPKKKRAAKKAAKKK